MEKYYWNPTREDRIGVCFGIFKDDNLDRGQIEALVDTFPNQSIDFFGALRSRVYDNAIREFIENCGLEALGKGILVSSRTNFEFETPRMDLVRPCVCGCCLLPSVQLLSLSGIVCLCCTRSAGSSEAQASRASARALQAVTPRAPTLSLTGPAWTCCGFDLSCCVSFSSDVVLTDVALGHPLGRVWLICFRQGSPRQVCECITSVFSKLRRQSRGGRALTLACSCHHSSCAHVTQCKRRGTTFSVDPPQPSACPPTCCHIHPYPFAYYIYNKNII